MSPFRKQWDSRRCMQIWWYLEGLYMNWSLGCKSWIVHMSICWLSLPAIIRTVPYSQACILLSSSLPPTFLALTLPGEPSNPGTQDPLIPPTFHVLAPHFLPPSSQVKALAPHINGSFPFCVFSFLPESNSLIGIWPLCWICLWQLDYFPDFGLLGDVHEIYIGL